jgi:hypothetical protein
MMGTGQARHRPVAVARYGQGEVRNPEQRGSANLSNVKMAIAPHGGPVNPNLYIVKPRKKNRLKNRFNRFVSNGYFP